MFAGGITISLTLCHVHSMLFIVWKLIHSNANLECEIISFEAKSLDDHLQPAEHTVDGTCQCETITNPSYRTF